jgi:hypothetical protein
LSRRDYDLNRTIAKEDVRYLNNYIELTSRKNSGEVLDNLHALENDIFQIEKKPIDLALATNMISVGLDVSRLGLMTVNGQPKTTAEYIQATSRVGRDIEGGPGLVVVLYDVSRSRDRSHFETFQYYHSKLYASVEPTSVTSFSTPVMKRFMHAVIISILRWGKDFSVSSERPFPPNDSDKEIISNFIINRIKKIDSNLISDAEKAIKSVFYRWENNVPEVYVAHEMNNEDVPLMYTSGKMQKKSWENRSFATPTSMRNVDQMSHIKIIMGEN